MIAPPGYRPVLELGRMASLLAVEVADARFSESVRKIPHPEDSKEHGEALRHLINRVSDNMRATQYTLVDRYLESVERIFLTSSDGQPLEISKQVVLPGRQFYQDQKDYIGNRDHSYEVVDTELWVVDCMKLEEARKALSDYFEGCIKTEFNTLQQHPRYVELLRRFDGFSLCVLESHFPKNMSELRGLLDGGASDETQGLSISHQILSVTRNASVSKAKVRELFPSLSVRQFEHHWKIAAEKRPEISRPGRKS